MATSSQKKIESEIFKIIRYYHFFAYAPSFELIHTFFPDKISKKKLRDNLKQLVSKHKLLSHLNNQTYIIPDRPENTFAFCPLTFNLPLYTLPQYSIFIQKQMNKYQITNNKLKLIQPYLRIISSFPFIRMIGITGSASMGNCGKNDDTDLCIITKSRSLWFSRFICVALAKIMGLYGEHVCLNLFFDESDLTVPIQKQTIYIGHELLQMKPIVNKYKTYERMLINNEWVFSLFPNAKKNTSSLRTKRCNLDETVNNDKKIVILACLAGRQVSPDGAHPKSDSGVASLPRMTFDYYNSLLSPFEALFKFIQLLIIHKNKTALIITPTQLWLFKKDFEVKLSPKKNYKKIT